MNHISMFSLVPKRTSVSMDLHCKTIQHLRFEVGLEWVAGRSKKGLFFRSLPCSGKDLWICLKELKSATESFAAATVWGFWQTLLSHCCFKSTLTTQATKHTSERQFLYLGCPQPQLVCTGCDWLLPSWLEIGGSLAFPTPVRFIWHDSAKLYLCACLLACLKASCLRGVCVVHALQRSAVNRAVSACSHL